jgi:tetratricopeptide (TPR) repeat protein
MVFAADDLGAWLTSVLADAGRKKLTELVLGSEQDRALRQAATAAIELTAAELRPEGGERTEDLARVLDQVFSASLPELLATGPTLLETLQAGIAAQLSILDDVSLTGIGQSSASVLELPAMLLAKVLTVHLISQIASRGLRGGSLEPLANQLSHDKTYLQSVRVAEHVDLLEARVTEVLERTDQSPTAVAARQAPVQLPSATAGFTGREDELAELAGLLDPDRTDKAVVVSAVAGLPGVGKTTLAVQAAYDALTRGWFSGGTLFVNLHGYDELPVQPSQALEGLLRALGVAAENIPLDFDQRTTVYRSVLAQHREPVLVIADNASSEAQVRPLLPGTGPHKLMVTSRHTLADLEARHVEVRVLDDETGLEMLATALHTARPIDNRIVNEPNAARQLVRYCDGLPLAIQIVAALLKGDHALSLAELGDELAVESERIGQLRYDDGAGQDAVSVAAAFELSYRRLEPTHARLFRLVSLNPGPDVSTAAAATLANLPVGKARRILGSLARAHLVEISSESLARWRMHDLIRLYAQRLSDEQASVDCREEALDRLFAYYLDTADTADNHLQGTLAPIEQAPFENRDEALLWFYKEHASLIDTVRLAGATGRDQIACRLPIMLARYFSWHRLFDDWLEAARISLDASRRIGDKVRQGIALNNLGAVLRETRRVDDAITACQESVAIHRELGDKRGESDALNNLGAALHEARRFGEAITIHQSDLKICRELGDRHGEADALNSLGLTLAEERRHSEAVSAHEQAAHIYRETRDFQGEASAMNNLGVALSVTWTGRPRAIETLTYALEMFRATGDHHREGTALNNLGAALRESTWEDRQAAISHHKNALDIFRKIGDHYGEAQSLNNLGLAWAKNGFTGEALNAHYAAVTIFRQEGDRWAEAATLKNLSAVLWKIGRFGDAGRIDQRAAVLFHEANDLHGEASALSNLGRALMGMRRFDEAITTFDRARVIYEQIGDWHGELQAENSISQARIARQAF